MFYRNQCHRWARGQPCKEKCYRLHMTRQQYEEIIRLMPHEVVVPVASATASLDPHQAGTELASAVLRVSALPIEDQVVALAAVASTLTLGVAAPPP